VFSPPFCPHRSCSQHATPRPGFSVRYGRYRAACRASPVQRYRCRTCRRSFSRQTFRVDYRDHRPGLNPKLFLLLASGIGLRQSSRVLGLSRRCTELKFRKIARHLRRLNLSLRVPLGGKRSFHLDEFESYEGARNTRPLSIPMLIESATRYIVWAESAPIRPRGKMTPRRKKALKESEERHGVRRDLSRRALARTLARGADLVGPARQVLLESDEKSSYPRLAREAFGRGRLVHRRTSSRLVRETFNPLFAINHEEAIARDLIGRLRRDSWLVSKERRYLDLALQLHTAFRNLVRRRFNRDQESPAQLVGFAPRRLSARELLSWRQEWGSRSVHPLSRSGASVGAWLARRTHRLKATSLGRNSQTSQFRTGSR
jgi:transposase-like protein